MNFDIDALLGQEAYKDLDAMEGVHKFALWGFLNEIVRVLLVVNQRGQARIVRA